MTIKLHDINGMVEYASEHDLAALRAEIERLRAFETEAKTGIKYLKNWCEQNHAGLSNRGVADAVVRMCDDFLAARVPDPEPT